LSQPLRRVLMVAYHFPPLAGSSGIQRTLRFVQHLPALGWQPLVLTAHPRAYERTSSDLLAEVPPSTVVRRAFALDTARHLSFKGRYVGAMARPDRWMSWRFDGVRQGLQLVREFRPEVIWSTFPVPTAHVIGAALQQRSGLPWVADFRDPMAQDGYPSDPVLWSAFDRLERQTVAQARLSVFTTPGAAREYQRRYPGRAADIRVLENGFDEESFQAAERAEPATPPLHPGRFTLLHSGIVYPEERDPGPLMQALGQLRRAGRLQADGFCLRFRAAAHEGLLHRLAAEHGVADLIETQPPLAYAEALQEMRRADALLVMQSSGCNEQIPAKTYEYLRAGRPVLCLSDPAGDTAGVLRDAGLTSLARLDDAADIARVLPAFVDEVRAGTAPRAADDAVRQASRRGRSEAFARMLAEAAGR